MDKSFEKKLERQKKKILRLEDTVRDKEDDIKACRRRHVDRKNKYYSSKRLSLWENQFQGKKRQDLTFRMPDQKLTVRNYSLMDDDLWQKMELRGWFDKYYRPQPLERVDLEQTRYLVPNRGEGLHKPWHREPTPAHSRPARAPERVQSPHWGDYQGNLDHAARRSAALAQGVRPMPAPWKDRPIQVEREGYTTFVPLDAVKQQRDAMLAEATRHAHDHNQQVAQRALAQNQGNGIFDPLPGAPERYFPQNPAAS